MAHDDIRARLAACPLSEFKTVSQAIQYALHYRRDVDALLAANEALAKALRLAATRMEILTGRMRGCHAETGKHELMDEAEEFCREARAALVGAETGAEGGEEKSNDVA